MINTCIFRQIKVLLLVIFGVLAQSAIANENLQKLMKKRECNNCNLTQVNLGFKNLTELELKRSNFNKAYLVNSDFSGANLSNSTLMGAYMNGVNLSNTNLENANFTNTELELADFTSANLRNIDFTGAYLLHAIITEKQFVLVRLCETVMPNASISNRDCNK